LVCPRLGLSVWFSGHSARAGQTLAKKAIKVKISAGGKSSHRVLAFQTLKWRKNTRSDFSCQAFSETLKSGTAAHPLFPGCKQS
jgi:hypothetical protein